MNPLELYERRLRARLEDWLAEKQALEPAELLDEAWEIQAELQGFAHAASLPDDEKLANLAFADLNIGAASGSNHAAGYIQLPAVVERVCYAIPYKWPDTPGTRMGTAQLPEALREKVCGEFENNVHRPLLEMEKTALILRTGQYLRLEHFHDELQDWLAEAGLGRPALLRLFGLPDTLGTIFEAYEGISVRDYLQADIYPIFNNTGGVA